MVDLQLHVPAPIKKSPVTTIDVFQLKILEKCQRINVNWYGYEKYIDYNKTYRIDSQNCRLAVPALGNSKI
jgi:hypothetical protein